jgi:hypothetical protein
MLNVSEGNVRRKNHEASDSEYKRNPSQPEEGFELSGILEVVVFVEEVGPSSNDADNELPGQSQIVHKKNRSKVLRHFESYR